MFATLDAVKGQPEIAKFQFQARDLLADALLEAMSGAAPETVALGRYQDDGTR